MRILKTLLAVLALFAAFPAAAEVRVSFYSHAWNAQGDGMYPHAFIRVTGRPAFRQARADQLAHFAAADDSRSAAE